MYGKVEFVSTQGKDRVLAVPESAVLDAGTTQSVLMDLGEGRFEPRLVKLGKHANGYVEVLDGLKAGEMAVVKANFLIDAESNLKAALNGFDRSSQDLVPGEARERRQIVPGSSGTVPTVPLPPSPFSPMSHSGEGVIEAIDVANTTVTLAHGPIASLSWPAMVMDFKVRDPALLRTVKPGQEIVFEITEASLGEYVIVRIQTPVADAAGDNRKNNRKKH
jgi:Cu(I)/Ag(I) efflux system membrane fusion protein